MTITAKQVASKLAAYLHHRISLAELVDWAERAMMEGDFGTRNVERMARIRGVVARLGLADVRAFGLTWEDCEQFLDALGYSARIEVVAGHSGPSPSHVREKPGKRYGR
jgi:hypothetical protein